MDQHYQSKLLASMLPKLGPLRLSGERCVVLHCSSTLQADIQQLAQTMQHGDIIYAGDGSLHMVEERPNVTSMSAFIQSMLALSNTLAFSASKPNSVPFDQKQPPVRAVCISYEHIGRQFDCVPVALSTFIEDPLDFFAPALSSPDGLHKVELDAKTHAVLLQRLSGGRPLNPKSHVFIFRDYEQIGAEMPSPTEVLIRSGFCSDLPDGRECALDERTPECYLTTPQGEQLPHNLDPVTQEARMRHQLSHMMSLGMFFGKIKPGYRLQLRGLPSETRADFEEVIVTDPCQFVRVRFEGTGKTTVREALSSMFTGVALSVRIDVRDGELERSYRMGVVTEIGPFANIPIWVCEPSPHSGHFGLRRSRILIPDMSKFSVGDANANADADGSAPLTPAADPKPQKVDELANNDDGGSPKSDYSDDALTEILDEPRRRRNKVRVRVDANKENAEQNDRVAEICAQAVVQKPDAATVGVENSTAARRKRKNKKSKRNS